MYAAGIASLAGKDVSGAKELEPCTMSGLEAGIDGSLGGMLRSPELLNAAECIEWCSALASSDTATEPGIVFRFDEKPGRPAAGGRRG